jgi:hypothetical protein
MGEIHRKYVIIADGKGPFGKARSAENWNDNIKTDLRYRPLCMMG